MKNKTKKTVVMHDLEILPRNMMAVKVNDKLVSSEKYVNCLLVLKRPYLKDSRDNTLDSGSFDWSADEADCDEEVRLITGTPPETEDEQITVSWTGEGNPNTDCSVCSTVVHSEGTSASSDRLNPPLDMVSSTPTNNLHKVSTWTFSRCRLFRIVWRQSCIFIRLRDTIVSCQYASI
jgi:hypothetical protein